MKDQKAGVSYYIRRVESAKLQRIAEVCRHTEILCGEQLEFTKTDPKSESARLIPEIRASALELLNTSVECGKLLEMRELTPSEMSLIDEGYSVLTAKLLYLCGLCDNRLVEVLDSSL